MNEKKLRELTVYFWVHNDKQRKSKGLEGKERRNDQPECPKTRWVKFL